MPSPHLPASVLIVEDDNLVAQEIILQLAKLDYAIADILSSGEEAVQQTARLSPDIILMDIMLAGSMDGIEAARQIQLSSNIPVVFLTAYAGQELLTRALSTRPFAWLQKPLKQRELELTLELVQLRHRLEEQARARQQPLQQSVSASRQALQSSSPALQQLAQQQQRDQTSLQRFGDALDDSADSIFLIDRTSMRFIDANRTACAILGYSRPELLEMGPHDINPYFNRQMLEQAFDKIAATQDRFGIIETVHQGKNHQMFQVEVRLRASVADGRAIMVAIARDITRRRQDEQALRRSEEQFRQITQNLQHVLWIRDVASEQVIYISDAYEKIWGRSVAQVYKRPRMLFADIHPDDRERITTAVQRMWRERHNMNEEYRLLRGDGQIRWLWTRTFPIRNDKGEIYRIGGITEDITERKENENTLHLSERKFRLIFECSPIGIGLFSTERRILEINPAFSHMLGYSQAELIGKCIADLTHPDDEIASTEIVRKLLADNTSSMSIEKRYLCKDGAAKWCKSIATLICDREQHPLFGLGMVENIDQEKQAEARRHEQEAAQKAALVREVHHRIKNHLQGVVGLMRQNAQKNSPCSSAIEEAITQINVVATIHGLQGKDTGEEIDLLQMLTAISHGLRDFLPTLFDHPIRVAGKVALYLNRDESVPIALALNELMINAAKHGNGPMEISLQRSSERALIRIENLCRATTAGIQPGSGLELVNALLQAEGASFRHECRDQHFLAEIVLTPPVIQINRETA